MPLANSLQPVRGLVTGDSSRDPESSQRAHPLLPAGPKPTAVGEGPGERESYQTQNLAKYCRVNYRTAAGFFSDQLTLLLLLLLTLLSSSSKLPAADNQLNNREKEDGWVLLFDGRTTNGWVRNAARPGEILVKEGRLNPHLTGHGLVLHSDAWSDFLLRLEFKLSPGSQSGVFVRSPSLTRYPGKDKRFDGIEIAIKESSTAGYADTGAIFDLVKPSKNQMRPVGEWNQMEIACMSNRVEVLLNRQLVTRADLDLFTEAHKRPDGSRHGFALAFTNHPRSGYIGFEDAVGDCWFRNIKIKPITSQSTGSVLDRSPPR